LALCSCGADLGQGRSSFSGAAPEYAQLQSAIGHSCTFRHAVALLRSYDLLSQDVGTVNIDNLFMLCPTLMGPTDDDDGDGGPVTTFTYFVMNAGKRKNVPVYAV